MTTKTRDQELAEAGDLPQADATSLIDGERLEREVLDMYRDVAREQDSDLHFEVGRDLALRLGYPSGLLDRIPAEAVDSFAGVGYALDLAAIEPGASVLDLGCGSGTDVFCAAVQAGPSGRVAGIDITDEQLAKAVRLRESGGFHQVELREARMEELPFENGEFDVVISNGVINLSPRKDRVYAETARVLRPGGRAAISDIISERPLRETTRRNVELWAACIAGAIPRDSYRETIEKAGLVVREIRHNDYKFTSEHAQDACGTYGVESATILAVK